jgi:hypothetical protein
VPSVASTACISQTTASCLDGALHCLIAASCNSGPEGPWAFLRAISLAGCAIQESRVRLGEDPCQPYLNLASAGDTAALATPPLRRIPSDGIEHS